MSQQRVTFLIDTMQTRGGMERVTATVAAGLALRGYAVEILTLRGASSTYPLPDGVTLTTLGFPAGHLKMRSQVFPFVRGIRKHLKKHRPDTLVVVDSFLCIYAYPAALGLRLRRVAWEHFHLGFDFGMRSRRLAWRLASFWGQDVVMLTTQDEQQWKHSFPRASAQFRAITNPLSFVRPSRNQYSLQNRTVLAVGWLDRRKGFDLLLEAWAQVEHQCPEWHLKIIGSGDEDQALRSRAAELKLKHWEIAPQTGQIEREYSAAGVYCLSSRYEGLPMVLIESQAYGVPAVSFDCKTGPSELLAPGGGLLVSPDDIAGLANALCQVMGDTELRQHMSDRAFQAANRFERESVLDLWVRFLEGQGGGDHPELSAS